MRCFNGSSTEYSLMLDALGTPGVPTRGSRSTRSDCSGRNSGSQALPYFLSAIPSSNSRASCSFCYDKGVWTRPAARLAARHGREFVRHVVPAVAKPARTLWNDFIAFLFCCLAVPFGFKTVSLARVWANHSSADAFDDLVRLCIGGFC